MEIALPAAEAASGRTDASAERVPNREAPLRRTRNAYTTELVLSATFVDSEANPVPGVEVRTAKEGQTLGYSDPLGRMELTVSVSATAGSKKPRRNLLIDCVAPNHAGERRRVGLSSPRTSASLGRIVLEPGHSLAGKVVTESGSPVPGVPVMWVPLVEAPGGGLPAKDKERWRPRLHRPYFPLEAETDGAGRFELQHLPLGPGYVIAAGTTLSESRSETMLLAAGSNPEIEVRVPEPRPAIRGVVYDPSGAPARGAEVTLHGPERPSSLLAIGYADITNERGEYLLLETRTDRMGRFAFDSIAGEGPFSLEVVPRNPVAYPVEQIGVVAGSSVGLSLLPPEWLTITILDEAGGRIPRGEARLTTWRGWLSYAQRAVEANGVLRALRPRQSFDVHAAAPGFRSKDLRSIDPEALGDGLELRLAAGSAVSGRVSHAGGPVAGASLVLSPAKPRRGVSYSASITDREEPFAVISKAHLKPVSATTDANGRFLASVRENGRHVLLVRAEGLPLMLFEAGELAVDGDGTNLDLILPRAGALEGEVLVPAGQTREGIRVGVSAGWGIAHTTLTDAAGRYAFSDLAPGSWQVRACPFANKGLVSLREGASGLGRVVWDCEVEEGATTRFDLNLRMRQEHTLRGCVQLGDEPLARCEVLVWPREGRSTFDDGSALARAQAGEAGCFELSLSTGGIRTIEARSGSWVVSQELEVVPGLLDWSPRIETGRLVLSGPAPTDEWGRPVRLVLLGVTESGARAWRTVNPYEFEHDPLTIDRAPAGRLQVMVQSLREAGSAGWTEVAETVLPAAGEVTVELP